MVHLWERSSKVVKNIVPKINWAVRPGETYPPRFRKEIYEFVQYLSDVRQVIRNLWTERTIRMEIFNSIFRAVNFNVLLYLSSCFNHILTAENC